MTFDELNKKCVAVYIKKCKYDYLSRTVKIVAEPNYGYAEELEGTTFKLTFHNCTQFTSTNTSLNMQSDSPEFISWNRKPIENSDHMYSYEFTNAFDDRVEFVAGECEIFTNPGG